MPLESDRVLARVQRYLIEVSEQDADPILLGPFTVYVSRVTSADWGTYALPTGELSGDWRERLGDVSRTFADRGRKGRMEWVDELFPRLRAAVADIGLTKVDVEPLLALASTEGLDRVSDFDIYRVGPDDAALRDLLEITRIAFDETEETSELTVAERRKMLRAENKVMVAARVDGVPVAAGVVTFVGGTGEITAIATNEPFRGRGLGSAITARLVRVALTAGCDIVYLTARDDAAARIYRKLGFERVGTYIEAARPD